jgi:hypothetical protein
VENWKGKEEKAYNRTPSRCYSRQTRSRQKGPILTLFQVRFCGVEKEEMRFDVEIKTSVPVGFENVFV